MWLGVQAIRHRADARAALTATDAGAVTPAHASRSLRIGFTVGVTNPKTIVFFVAFLPQFVNEPAGHTGLQLALLGLVFGVMAVASDRSGRSPRARPATGSPAGPSASTGSPPPAA